MFSPGPVRRGSTKRTNVRASHKDRQGSQSLPHIWHLCWWSSFTRWVSVVSRTILYTVDSRRAMG